MINSLKDGIADIAEAIRLRAVWLALASENITDQHRRTTLGPIWLLLNYLAFAGTFLVVFSRGGGIPSFATYVAIGLLVWLYILEVVSSSVTLFVKEEPFIKGTKLPLSVYVFQLTTQASIRALYSLVGCVGIIFFTAPDFSIYWLWSIVGVAIILLATPAACIVFAMAGAFFPDLQFIVSNVMRLGLFLTPIFWIRAGDNSIRAIVHDWNPFTYFLEIVRSPIYSGTVSLHAIAVCGTITVSLWIAAIFLLGRNRKNLVFVL